MTGKMILTGVVALIALLVVLIWMRFADAQIFTDQTADMNGPVPSSGGLILLSNTTIPSTATIGTTVGTLSVPGGTGSYTFSLTSNPGGLYSISGSALQVAASLSPGSDPITVKADNGAGSVLTQPFAITVTGAPNLRITSTGAFRITSTGANRSVSP